MSQMDVWTQSSLRSNLPAAESMPRLRRNRDVPSRSRTSELWLIKKSHTSTMQSDKYVLRIFVLVSSTGIASHLK